MLGSLVSSLSQRLVRMATTALMLSGAGLAGYSYYIDQYKAADPRANAAITFFQEHATWFLVLGVVGVVVGFTINMVTMRAMQKRMMGGMGGLGGLGGPGPAGMSTMSGMAGMSGVPSAASMGGIDPAMLQRMAVASQGTTAAGAQVVKVRCPSCKGLETESASFCSSCGKPLR
jgi:hypothetical protein